MICVYPADCTDFSTNGNGTIEPTSALVTETAEDVEFENVNPVDAILGEDGAVEKYTGELTRDWWDVFVVKRVGQDTNVQIRQTKNLLGISYDIDLTDVVTRITPTGEDANGNVLYLPELYIDSPLIDTYTHPKWIHLPVSEAKEDTDGDDAKTKAECYRQEELFNDMDTFLEKIRTYDE